MKWTKCRETSESDGGKGLGEGVYLVNVLCNIEHKTVF